MIAPMSPMCRSLIGQLIFFCFVLCFQNGFAQDKDLQIIYDYAAGAYTAGQYNRAAKLLSSYIRDAQQQEDVAAEVKGRVLLSDTHEKLKNYPAYFSNREALAVIYFSKLEAHEEALATLLTVNLQYRIYLQHWEEIPAAVAEMERLSELSGKAEYHFRGLVLQVAGAMRQNQPKATSNYLREADSLYRAASLAGDEREPDLYLLYSTHLFNQGQLREALARTEEGIRVLKNRRMSRRDSSYLSSLYNNVGINYLNIGDYEAAIIQFRNAVTLTRELGLQTGNKSRQQRINLLTAASVLQEWNFAFELIDELDEQLEVPQNRVDSVIWLQAKNNMLYAYLKANKKPEKVKKIVAELSPWREAMLDDYIHSYRFFGWAAATEGDSLQAFARWSEGNHYARTLGKEHSQAFHYLLEDQIKAYVRAGNPDSAARYITYADTLFTGEKKGFQLNLNSVLQSLLNRHEYLLLCQSEGLPEASGLWSLSLEIEGLIDSLRQGHSADNSKQYLADRAHDFYEHMIATAARLHGETGEAKYLEAAFRICQKSKSGLLLDELRKSGATSYAGIPDELLVEERNLKSLLQYYQEQLHEAEEQGDTDKKDEAGKQLFSLQEAKLALEQRLAQEYPAYYDLSYQNRLAEVSSLQQMLHEQGKEAFVEFFAGKEHIFTFLITNEKLELLSQDRDKLLNETIEHYLRFLHDAELQQKLPADSLLKRFALPAHSLYTTLIAPITDRMTAMPENWVVSPDGLLGFMPLESLITRPAGRGEGFSDLAYLIRETTISYSYSASVWLQNAQQHQRLEDRNAAFRMLGFAPGYTDFTREEPEEEDMIARLSLRSGKPGELSWSLRELDSIRALFTGDYYHDSLATRERFLSLAANYRMIHLAMHGYADPDNPMQSGLLFSPLESGGEVETLYAYELTNLRLHADLVVLSACETGIGKFMRGEGIMSLARSFMYAGASSVVMTLWKIEDEATAGIMADFYEQLNQEVPKDQALRTAKLNYLNNSYEQFANPFYWSGFVMMGETGPIVPGKPFYVRYWWLALLILPLAFIAFRLKK